MNEQLSEEIASMNNKKLDPLPLTALAGFKTQRRYSAKKSLKDFEIGGIDTETQNGYAKLVSYEVIHGSKSISGTYEMNSFFDFITGIISLGYEPKSAKHKSTIWCIPQWFFYNLQYDHNAILKYLPNDIINKLNKGGKLILDAKTETELEDSKSGHAIKISLLTKKSLQIKLTGEEWENVEFISVRTGYKRKIGKKKVSAIKCWDIAQWYRGSLKDNAVKHLDSSLNKIDIDPISLGYKKGWNDDGFWNNHLDEIKEYAEMDAIITGKLARLQKDNLETIGARFNNPYSCAKIAEQYLLDQNYKETISPFLKSEKGIRFMMMGNTAYHGGHFEISNYGKIENASLYDIKSAYPYTMYSLPSLTKGNKINGIIKEGYGVDDWNDWLSYRNVTDIGFVRAVFIFEQNQKWNPLCKFNENIKGLYTPSIVDKIMTVAEYIEAIKWNPLSVVVGEFMYFIPASKQRPFAYTIDKLFTLKESNKPGSPEYQVSKILINSLYGKLIQGRKEDQDTMGNLYNPVYAAIVTGTCRAMLAEANRTSGMKAVMFATDGILFKDLDSDWNPPNRILPSIYNLGEWEIEKTGDAIILDSGVYTIGDFTDLKTLKSTYRGDNGINAIKTASNPDWLTFLQENANVGEISGKSRERPLSAKQAHARGKPEMTNIFISQDWNLNVLPSSRKRMKAEKVPENFGDLINNNYELIGLLV